MTLIKPADVFKVYTHEHAAQERATFECTAYERVACGQACGHATRERATLELQLRMST